MTYEEKVLLIDLLLTDIRLNWAYDLTVRLTKARELAIDTGLVKIVERIDGFMKDMNSRWGVDGRHFRTSYTNGGYEGLSSLHGLYNDYHDKSEEFKYWVDELLTCSDMIFGDL